MGIDYSKMERLPRKWTPDFVLWLKDHAIVSQTIRTSNGATVRICENYVLEATPEEIEARKREIQRVAARALAQEMAKQAKKQ